MCLLAVLTVACDEHGIATAPPAPLPPAAPAAYPVHITVAASTADADRAARRRAAERYEATHPGVVIGFVDSRDLVAHRDRFATQLLTAMSDEVDVYEVDADTAAALAGHAVDVSRVVAAAPGRVDAATLAVLTVRGGLVGVPLGRDRALLVSRYSRAPRIAVDVALALAGLDSTAEGEDGAG